MKVKLLIAALILCGVTMFTACGGGNKTDNNSEKPGTTQGSGGSDNSPGTSINTGQDMKWPSEFMGNLPEPKGKITAILKDDKSGTCTVAFSEMTLEDAKTYAAKIKELGYKDGLEVSDADGVIINGRTNEGYGMGFAYNSTAKEGTVWYSKNGSPASDLTDAAPWPKDFIKGVPELDGKIVDVVNDNNKSVTVHLEYVKKENFEAYVEQLKKNGYTVETDEIKNVDSIDFRAYNADREWVHAYLQIRENNNSATVEMEKASK